MEILENFQVLDLPRNLQSKENSRLVYDIIMLKYVKNFFSN